MRESESISILIVEDNPTKLASVLRELRNASFECRDINLDIQTADCFSSAQRQLTDRFFDIVILDLMIPVTPTGEARLETGKDLYRSIRTSQFPKPFHVVGLTSAATGDVDDIFKSEPGLNIQRFDESGIWLGELVERVDFVLGAKSGLLNHLGNSFGIDVLIITARKGNEYDPIYGRLEWHGARSTSDSRLAGRHNAFGRVALRDGKVLSVGLVCLDEMGLSHSAALVSSMIAMYRPRYLAMLGMCCGLKKLPHPNGDADRARTKLGDIVVASQTYCWEEGKYSDAEIAGSTFFNNRATHKQPDIEFWRRVNRFLDQEGTRIESEIEEFYKSANLKKVRSGLRGGVKFRTNGLIHKWPMVSGPCVVDSATLIEEIETRFPQAFALEMEAHSIYSAADCCIGAAPNVLVIKGVADFGDGTKAKALQPLASAASFDVFKAILESEFCG
jgi:nucleoside phosphorylase/CheY-like chemotaxis protein